MPKKRLLWKWTSDASALLDTTAGLTSSEILDYQLGKVRETLDQYRHAKGRKIVFIHGKGEGVLRNALLKEIRDKYKNCSCQECLVPGIWFRSDDGYCALGNRLCNRFCKKYI